MKRLFAGVSLVVCACAISGAAQSLGEMSRLEKARQSKLPPRHVITNDELQHPSSTAPATPETTSPTTKPPAKKELSQTDTKPTAAGVTAVIRAQKEKIKALEDRLRADQKKLDEHNTSVKGNVQVSDLNVYEYIGTYNTGAGLGPSPGLCAVANASYGRPDLKDWCAEPDRLQDDMDKTQAQLDQERQRLEAMQEEARHMGFNSVVYDPD